MALFISSCIFAWSSWDMSFDFSESFCCSIVEFCSRAALA